VLEFPLLEGGSDRRLLFETIRRVLSSQVHDVIDTSAAALAQARLSSSEDAKASGRLIHFSADMRSANQALKRFLFHRLYRHPQVVQTTDVARWVTRELFDAYLSEPRELPDDFAAREDRRRAVADYVAGMTDRFALREHQRLTGRLAFADLPAAPDAQSVARI
jgi:dGTPase